MNAWDITTLDTIDGQIVLTGTFDGQDHSIVVPPEAIGSRQVAYDLDDPREALIAIIREHGVRIASLSHRPDGLDGLDQRITVELPSTSAILQEHAATIDVAREARTPPAEDDAA